VRPFLVVLLALLAVSFGRAAGPAQLEPLPRPTIVVLQTDDQTADSLRVMANVRRLIVAAGASFETALSAIPSEPPSLAVLLSGRYAHGSGLLDAQGQAASRLGAVAALPVWLQRAGYYTVFLGLYPSGYAGRQGTDIPPGWSAWYAPVATSRLRYLGYTLNENGRLARYGRGADAYQTDVLAAKAVAIVAQRARMPQPLFLWASFLAPRAGLPAAGRPREAPLPAPRHQGRFASEALPLPPSFNEADVADKPAAVRERPLLDASAVAEITARYRLRLESLLAVDEAVAGIVEALQDAGRLDQAWIIFTSASGFLAGEHRVPRGKALPYEPAVRVPLVVRGPGVAAGLRLRQPVSTVDLVPTILDMAGVEAGSRLDGRSLLPVLRDPGLFYGRDLLIEGPGGGARAPSFAALRTPRYLYVQYATGEEELYDLARDPYELTSLHALPSRAALRAELARRLQRLARCAGASCRLGPALTLRLRLRGDCFRPLVEASIGGSDTEAVRRVAFFLAGRRVGVDGRPPFRLVTRLPAGAPALRAHILLADGREVSRDRLPPACPG
jgi:arylsulfatase A-like enzyme